MIRLNVTQVTIAPMSTVGIGYGYVSDPDKVITFAGDHRPMRALGEALKNTDEPIVVEIEEWQLTPTSRARMARS